MSPKEELILQFSDIYFKYGFKSITMDDLAYKLSISKKTIYSHFENKAEIISHVIDYFLEDLNKYIQEALKNKGDIIDKLLDLNFRIINILHEINPLFFYTLKKYYYNQYQVLTNYWSENYFNAIKLLIDSGIQKELFRKDIYIEYHIYYQLKLYSEYIFEKKPEKFLQKLDEMNLFSLLITNIRGITTIKGYKLLEKKNTTFF